MFLSNGIIFIFSNSSKLNDFNVFIIICSIKVYTFGTNDDLVVCCCVDLLIPSELFLVFIAFLILLALLIALLLALRLVLLFLKLPPVVWSS